MTILFYPEDVIAVNPKLKGFDATTFNPVFFPRPENWTIEGAGADATAAFASWQPPSQLIPMYTTGYNESNIFGPVYNALYEYDSWDNKKLVPALADRPHRSRPTASLGHYPAAGREMAQRGGVHRRRRQVHLGHHAQQRLWLSCCRRPCAACWAATDAYKVTGTHEITVTCRSYNMLFLDWVMGSIAIMPEHAYKDIKPEALRGHVASTWLGTLPVKTSDGKTFTARGGVGTGPWIPQGFDPRARPTASQERELLEAA